MCIRVRFYSNSNVDRLKNSYCKFISAGQNVSDLYKGKKAVLDALKRISEDKVLSPEVKKCMFIVDRAVSYTHLTWQHS